MNPALFKHLINLYPPYWATGIRVVHAAKDYRSLTVQMRLRFYNRNAKGTHFGGSLYAMTDPFYMLMLMEILGSDYQVWDRSASIEFLCPGQGTVTARFIITDAAIQRILTETAGGDKYFPEFSIDVMNPDGKIAARVLKTLYVRKKFI